jgi:hypothetical protein
MWVKLDDGFARHPKILAIPDPALRLHLDAMCYAAGYLTDGRVETGALLDPKPARIRALVEVGLWVPIGAGRYELHDWHDYQPSADDVRKRRAATAERLRRWRERNAD